MPDQQTVLLLGGTGRTGRRVMELLLSRSVRVRVVVRSAERLPAGATDDPKVSVVEADLLSLSDEELVSQVRGCDAVVSCLGHATSFAGVFGPPRDLVTQATMRLCNSIEVLRPTEPVKYILMSSVLVNHPGGERGRRGMLEKTVLRLLRAVVPPASDNQRASDFLFHDIGTANEFTQWVAVRPDTLLEGDGSEYILHEGLVSSLFAPGSTNMANVAHFMCELVTNPRAWDDWNGKLPVIVNASSK